MASSAVKPSHTAVRSRSRGKLIFWIILGVAFLSVIPFSEIPILTDKTGPEVAIRALFYHDRFLLIPHALCAFVALVIGPIQFSSRIRQKHLRLHRVLGRVYVFAVLIAASTAFAIVHGRIIAIGVYIQGGAWIVCTLAAFLTARNRQIVKHRQWMIRSYAVTFTFVGNRFLDFWPTFHYMSLPNLQLVIITTTLAAVFLPEIAFSWRELTTRRA